MMMIKVKKANIEIAQLFQLFTHFDTVKMNVRRGYAYVQFTNPEKGQLAFNHLNRKKFNQEALILQPYKWKGNYDEDDEEDERIAMQIEQLEKGPPKLKSNSKYQFHPLINQLRVDFMETLELETQQLDKSLKKADYQINLMPQGQKKQAKSEQMSALVDRERHKIKKYLIHLNSYVSSRLRSLYSAPKTIDLQSGIHRSKSRIIPGQNSRLFQHIQKFVTKNPVTKLLTISNTQFLASFQTQPKNPNRPEPLNTISIYDLKDAEPKHTFDNLTHPVRSISSFSSLTSVGVVTWALFGEQEGYLQSLQIDPFQDYNHQQFYGHSTAILDIKPLLDDHAEKTNFYLTHTANSIRKIKVELQERSKDIYGIDVIVQKDIIPTQGKISCFQILSKNHLIVSLCQHKVKLFDLNKCALIYTDITDKVSPKLVKIDQNIYASISKNNIVLTDTRGRKKVCVLENPSQVNTMALFDTNRMVYGGYEMIGFVDWRKNISLWRDQQLHPKSTVREIIVVDDCIVSADNAGRLTSWNNVRQKQTK